ncbi:MAG: response regulator transcription factor [Planctomycetes bacterium]|nr:response regulator transcription factor [Planctomycetota bacterium]MBL7143952.1 response regulator transcription factor [Phycisphaerae bacterium]
MQELGRIRVLLAEDHAIVREGLRLLLEKQPDIEVVCEAEDGRIAVERARELLPDVVVMDITMPNLNGVEATRKIINEFPQIKVIALSIHSDRRFVARMLEAGATGYVLKEGPLDELVKAIWAVTAGESYLSSKITSIVIDDYVKGLATDADSTLSFLTNRECRVLQLIAEGKSTEQIALDLVVSSRVIEAIRRRIMKKLGAHTIADLVKIAIFENLISLEL